MCSPAPYSPFSLIQALLRIRILLSESGADPVLQGEPAMLVTGQASLLALGFNVRKAVCLHKPCSPITVPALWMVSFTSAILFALFLNWFRT